MIGLIGLIVVVVYAALVIKLTRVAWRMGLQSYGANIPERKTKAYLYGVAGFCLITLPVFWETIPTYVTYKLAVHQAAGLKIRKTFEQWRSENPDVTAELLRQPGGEYIALPSGARRYPVNPRISSDTYLDKRFFTVVVYRIKLVDLQTNEVLAEFTEVLSGNSGGIVSGGDGWWKFWLLHDSNKDLPDIYQSWIELNGKFRGEEARK
jgi:hypothetical protein